MTPLCIAYLNEEADLSGGVRVMLAHADELIARGHSVTIVSKSASPSWIRTRAEWQLVTDFTELDASIFDFVIATFWTTLAPAHQLAGDRALHLCQGYEGSFSFYAAQKREIDAAYSLAIPRLVISESLVQICRQFHDDVTVIGQVVDDRFYRDIRKNISEPPRVLVTGAHQVDLKGVDDGYGAVLHARANGAKVHMVRVSPWAPARDEPSDIVADEFHVALTADAMTELVHSCDIFVGPNHKEEGFGLPAAEAMASAIPCVLTSIPSFLSFDEENRDYALFANEKDAIDLGERLLDLITDDELRERTATRGREVAEQFRSHRSGERLEAFLLARAAAR